MITRGLDEVNPICMCMDVLDFIVMMMMLAVALHLHWEVHQVDDNPAFLRSLLNQKIFMTILEHFKEIFTNILHLIGKTL